MKLLLLVSLQLLALIEKVGADYVDIEQVFFSKLSDYDETMVPDTTEMNSKSYFLNQYSCKCEL